MCDKHSKTIIKTLEQDEVYIIKYITKNLNKFVLIFTVYTPHSETVFSVTVSDTSLHDDMTDFSDINTVSLNEKIKIYKF